MEVHHGLHVRGVAGNKVTKVVMKRAMNLGSRDPSLNSATDVLDGLDQDP